MGNAFALENVVKKHTDKNNTLAVDFGTKC